ncbi:MAG: CoA transferase [Nitriliruptorales bacterium]|nr:CoA transferase [Nitriliruptorales bacterium]
MPGPLEGVTVLEMANVITGPYAGMLLADLGAEVIKVEMPGTGDLFRHWAGDKNQFSPPFAAFNRNKKSVTINVKTTRGVECYLRLAASVDVILENFRPGTLDRMGVGYNAVKEINPRIVYCAISGMGQSGPDSHRPTYDAIAQALSGLWSQLTEMNDPEPVGPPLCDQLGGLYAAYGVLGALLHRAGTGQGQRLDVSMLGAAMGFQTNAVAGYLMQSDVADKFSRAKRSQTYAFVAADRRPFAIHLSTPDKFWRGLADATERPDLLSDPRFKTKTDRIANYEALRAELAGVFETRDRDEWVERLQARDVPAAPINTIAEALDEPQVRHLEMVRTFGQGDEALELVGFPVDYAVTPAEPGDRPPLVGEHTDSVLRSIGLGAEDIEGLRSESAI